MIRMIITFLAFTFSASLVLGAPQKIEIDSTLFFKGKKIGSPRILAKNGEKAKILMNDQKNGREYNLEVLPVVSSGNKIKLRYSVAVRENRDETISHGEISVPENKNGRIYIDRGRIQIHLKVKKS